MSFKQKAVILQHKDENICNQSTAGGAFTAIAEYILDNGGVVFGVEFDKDFKVQHTCIEKKNDLKKFRNSKYVQSSIGDSYKRVKEQLESGRIVCFSGTPCQIEGLRIFLRKEYANLVLVDVVCRAVPSPGVWSKYIEMEKNRLGGVKSVRFRDKTLGYQFSTMEIINSAGAVERGGIDTQPWLRMFFSGMIIRPSCTECRFRNPNRHSDFTIWDCFNSYAFDRSFDETKGTTRMLIHSENGWDIFNSIKGQLIYKEIEPELAIKNVKEMCESPMFHEKREEFFKDYSKKNIQELLDKYFPLTAKRKIKNGLRIVLNKIGLDVVLKRWLSS